MKNNPFVILAICLTTVVAIPFSASAKKKAASTDASASPAASVAASASPAASAAAKVRPVPFHGMATAVDQKGQTFTIAGKEKSRVFKVTTNTKISKAGKDATMADIVDNSEISGSYWKHEDGSLEAKTVKIGPKGEKKEKAKKEKASDAASPAASTAASPKP